MDEDSWAKVARTIRERRRTTAQAAASSQVEFISEALPRFVGAGKYADSALRKKVLEWNFSAAGLQWQRERKKVLGDDAGDDEPDLHDGEILA